MEIQRPPHTAEAYKKAHAAIVNNRYWYSDEPQLLSDQFNAAETRKRALEVISILRRAARRRDQPVLSAQYSKLADKLAACPVRHRGSSACLECLRAFQQAKAVAQREVTIGLTKPQRLLCLVTIIPRDTFYPCGTLHEFVAADFNHHLIDSLKCVGIAHPFAGSIDFSLETSTALGKYWQPHWHYPRWTDDPIELRKLLLEVFSRFGKYDYPVDVTEARDFGFFPYINKALKIVELLRTGRTHLPELLLVLDGIKPLDLMVTHGLVLSAQDGGFQFEMAL